MRELQGFGLGLRRAFAAELLERAERGALAGQVDWLEIVPENWMFFGGWDRRVLLRAAACWPIVPHSVSLNLGGLDPLDAPLLAALAALVREVDAPCFADHLCYSSVRGRPLHGLLPLPWTREAADNAAQRAREVAARVGRPLVLENVTYDARMPGAELDEAGFLRAVLERGGCGLLLDVNNIVVNARNHDFDPVEFVNQMPMDAVRYIHLAGYSRAGELYRDTHIGPVSEEVWALYRHVLRRAGRLVPTLVEWDQELPPLDGVLAEVDRARAEAGRALGREAVQRPREAR